MTGPNVFPVTSLNRAEVRWEDYLSAITPVTTGAQILYKREDLFAPMGYGGINGSKLRQLIHLVSRARAQGARGVITGASVLSPQVSMGALVAAHYGLPARIVLGATRPDTCIRHENVAIAQAAGAEFVFTPVGFNPALQGAVTRLTRTREYEDWYRLCYGISEPADAPLADIAAFHALGAAQTVSIPPGVHTLVMTCGSAYSCASVLLGIALQRPAGLRRVVLLGIGPTRLQFLQDRLTALGHAYGINVTGVYRRRYHDHPALEAAHQAPAGPVLLEHHDLHVQKFARYADRMAYRADGIDLHPTYEGKALTYLDRHREQFSWYWSADRDVMFWIVGSAPTRRAMAEALAA